MQNKKIILVLIILILGIAAGYYLGAEQKYEKGVKINSFEECVAAGYPVLGSYPLQCTAPDGRNFIRQTNYPINLPPQNNTPTACTMEAKLCPDGSYVGRSGPNCEFAPCPTSPSQGECFIGGCSGQICSDQEGVLSTCEYLAEYACYQGAKCERQSSGQCGWTQTEQLRECLNSARQ